MTRNSLLLPLLSGLTVLALAPASFGQESKAMETCKNEDCCEVGKTSLETFQKAIEAQRGKAFSGQAAPLPRGDLARAIPGEFILGYTQLQGLQPVLKEHKLTVIETLPEFRMVTVRGPQNLKLSTLTAALKGQKALRFIEANVLVKSAALPNDPFLPRQKGLTNSGMEQAWAESTGQGVIVAVLDTGVDINHPDLQGRLLPGYDFVNNSPVMRDDNGHGTAVAGIIAARANNGHGIAGVAPQAMILPIKVADRSGVATVATVLKGMQMAVGRGAKIINLSMGTRLPSVALRGSMSAAYLAGVTVISSAGNDAAHKAMYPAAWPEVLGVTVTSDDGELGFSGVLAPNIELGAPGEEIPTTLPGGVYGFISGSSASAAMASGVAALALSKEPKLTPLSLGRALIHSQDPIAALEPFRDTYRFGRVNAFKALQRAQAQLSDLALETLSVSPTQPQPGQRCVARVRMVNAGYTASQAYSIQLTARSFLGTSLILETQSQVALGVGEERVLTIPFTAPAGMGPYTLKAQIIAPDWNPGQKTKALPGEFSLGNDQRSLVLPVIAGLRPNLRIISRSMSDPNLDTGTAQFEVVVENIGNTLIASAQIQAKVGGKALAAPNRSNPLAPGQRHRFVLSWTIPKPAPTGLMRFEARISSENGDLDLSDNQCAYDFVVGRSDQLQSLYQQSNGVDVIHDAPRMILASHPYVPVQVFVPSKGSIGTITRLEARELQIKVADNNKGNGARLIYRDTRGSAPSVSPSGLVIVDELGQDIGSTDLFAGQDLTDNGRHNVLRVPTAEFQLGSAAKQARYVDVTLNWAYKRTILWIFTQTRTGRHRKVLKVEFLPSALPQLPGDNHYYDVHHHTIAEWFFDNPLNIVAPRKAYGGPIQMIKEMAHGMGITPSVNNVFGLVITTDHNAFFNQNISNPNGPEQRPPFGPASINAQPGTTEFDAYRNIFGPSAGEELAVKQNVPVPSVNSFVDRLTAILPGLPLGAHMLTYLGNHVEGPWHGGGFLGGPNIDVNLAPTLNDLAKNDQQNQSRAFTYAAHPFGGMGWNDSNFNNSFGLVPSARNRDHLHDGSRKFVLKGLEFWNGAGRRKLASSKIDFKNLDPWSDDDFARGSKGWDGGIHKGLIRWHSFLSKTLDYSFVSDPETVFIRKIYVAAGSDAHGDFNFSTGRTATPLSLRATYSCSDSHLFDSRTYVFGDGKPGANNYDRYMAAYADGNTIMTDGPVLNFSMDANTKFNSSDLIWHDSLKLTEDKEGQIGGGGAFDGARTMLVRRDTEHLGFNYQWNNNAAFGSNNGEVTSIHIYKTELGAPNPTRSVAGRDQLQPLGRLDPKTAGSRHSENLNPSEEGSLNKLGLYALGAFTGGDPDSARLGVEERRCFTNPIWAIPYDVSVTANPDPATGTIPVGELRVTITFDASMNGNVVPSFEIKALDAQGDSTDVTAPPLTMFDVATGTGWSFNGNVRNGTLTLVNRDAISLNQAAYPAAGEVTFVVYSRDPIQDAAGNDLNRIAFTFKTQQNASGGTVVVPVTSGGGAAPAPAPRGSSGGSSSFFGCDLAPGPKNGGDPWSLFFLAALFGALALIRRR